MNPFLLSSPRPVPACLGPNTPPHAIQFNRVSLCRRSQMQDGGAERPGTSCLIGGPWHDLYDLGLSWSFCAESSSLRKTTSWTPDWRLHLLSLSPGRWSHQYKLKLHPDLQCVLFITCNAEIIPKGSVSGSNIYWKSIKGAAFVRIPLPEAHWCFPHACVHVWFSLLHLLGPHFLKSPLFFFVCTHHGIDRFRWFCGLSHHTQCCHPVQTLPSVSQRCWDSSTSMHNCNMHFPLAWCCV